MYMSILKHNKSFSEKNWQMKQNMYKMLKNPDYMHQCICKIIGSKRADSNILFRVEDAKNEIVIYIQSKDLPDDRIASKFGFVIKAIHDLDKVLSTIKENERVTISIFLSPIKRNNNTVYRLANQNERLDYVKRKFTESGLNVLWVEETHRQELLVERSTKDGSAWTFSQGDFLVDGIVVDRKKFVDSIINGYGRGKSFGTGMVKFL